MRARTDGDQNLRVEVQPISIARAHELLTDNPNLFASQPDEVSRLRKLQTHVEIIGAKTGFRISDPNSARRVAPVHQPVVATEASEA